MLTSKPSEVFGSCGLSASYNYFYQTIYGPELTFTLPAALLQYLWPLHITSYTQLEALFVLWNAAQLRSPLQDSCNTSRSSKFRQNRSSRSFATRFTQRKSWGFSVAAS